MSNIIRLKQRKSFSLKSLKRVSFKGKLLFVVAVIIFTAALLSGYYIFKNQKSDNRSKTASTSKLKENYDEANNAVYSGDYSKGQDILDDALNKSTTDVERSTIYIQKSTLALKSSKSDEAIKFANTAEKTYPSRMSAIVLAMSYEGKGDKALALKYFKLVLERFTEQERSIAPADYEYYQSKVKELSS